MIKIDAQTPIRTLADAERAHILKVLQQVGGVVGGRNGAAVRLGLPRTTLILRMRRLGIASQRTARFFAVSSPEESRRRHIKSEERREQT